MQSFPIVDSKDNPIGRISLDEDAVLAITNNYKTVILGVSVRTAPLPVKLMGFNLMVDPST